MSENASIAVLFILIFLSFVIFKNNSVSGKDLHDVLIERMAIKDKSNSNEGVSE